MSNISQNNNSNKRTNDNMNENELLESSENPRIEPLNKKLKLNVINNDEKNILPSKESTLNNSSIQIIPSPIIYNQNLNNMTFKDIINNYDLLIKKYQSNIIILNENYKTLNENYNKIYNEYNKLKDKLNENKIVDLSNINDKYTYINSKLFIKLFINDNIFILRCGYDQLYNNVLAENKIKKEKINYIIDAINYKTNKFYNYLLQIKNKYQNIFHFINRNHNDYCFYKMTSIIEFTINEDFIKNNNEIYQTIKKDILNKFEKLINYIIKKFNKILG